MLHAVSLLHAVLVRRDHGGVDGLVDVRARLYVDGLAVVGLQEASELGVHVAVTASAHVHLRLGVGGRTDLLMARAWHSMHGHVRVTHHLLVRPHLLLLLHGLPLVHRVLLLLHLLVVHLVLLLLLLLLLLVMHLLGLLMHVLLRVLLMLLRRRLLVLLIRGALRVGRRHSRHHERGGRRLLRPGDGRRRRRRRVVIRRRSRLPAVWGRRIHFPIDDDSTDRGQHCNRKRITKRQIRGIVRENRYRLSILKS